MWTGRLSSLVSGEIAGAPIGRQRASDVVETACLGSHCAWWVDDGYPTPEPVPEPVGDEPITIPPPPISRGHCVAHTGFANPAAQFEDPAELVRQFPDSFPVKVRERFALLDKELATPEDKE